MQETLTLLTTNPTYPVTLADAKGFLRVDVTDDDSLIAGLIAAATRYCEAVLKKSLINRQYRWNLDYFPNRLVVTPVAAIWDTWLNTRLYPYTAAQVLTVPKPPLISVESITYYDTNGTQQTLANNLYVVEPGTPGRISPAPGTQYPATEDRIGAVAITFTSGDGTDGSMSDPIVQVAIKQLVAHWYRNREAVGESLSEAPLGVRSLLNAASYGFYA